MIYMDMKGPWIPKVVILGDLVSTQRLGSGGLHQELEDTGCRGRRAMQLIVAAAITSSAICKMMEKIL